MVIFGNRKAHISQTNEPSNNTQQLEK
jgi:hypothetical protein